MEIAPLKIDIRSPQGNTLEALGLATTLMREAGAAQTEIDRLQTDVFNAQTAAQARKAIEAATREGIVFVDSQTGERA